VALHPQAAKFLEELAARNPPAWSELPVAEARELFKSLDELFGAREPVQAVRDLQTTAGLHLRVYHPDSRRNLPAVLYFHGGGWVLGDCDTHDSLCRRLANQSQCCVVSVDYGRAPEHQYPQPLNDCYSALEYVVEHRDQLRVDAKRLGVAGDSAGGNLAAGVALTTERRDGPKLTCQLLIYPVIEPDFESASYREFAEGYGLTRESMMYFWQSYLATPDQTAEAEACPSRAASLHGMPRTYVLTAEYDVLRDEGEAFADQLIAAAVPTTRRRYDGMLHGFLHLASAFDDGQQARDDAARFLQIALHEDA
jgi:acetyl esterase